MAIGGEFTRRLLQDAGIQAGMRVLDVGCGTGDVTLIAADLVGPSGRVLRIDRYKRLIEAAHDRALAADFGNATFEPRDIDALPAEPFDAIVGRRALMYHPDPAAAAHGLIGAVGDLMDPLPILRQHKPTHRDPAPMQ